MRFKEVALSNASPEAKIAGLAVLLDKELLRLSEVVLNTKKLQGPQGEQGLQGPKGEQGDRGFDGTNGKDGSNGKDGKDGEEGKQGVGVQDAKIDFDGSLVITLTDGTEINAGDVVPMDTAEKIRVIGNGGGTSQYVLDAIEAINAVIETYGTIATQDADAVAITGGAIDGTTVGATTATTGKFTTLIGGADQVNYGQLTGGATTKAVEFKSLGSDTNVALALRTQGTGAIDLAAGSRGVNISNGGAVTAITRTAGGTGYATAPTVAITAPTTAGGVQATATVAVSAGAITTFTITNAGSGYVEQPTVTFSGGGGSGAAAYATVGSGTAIKSLGSTFNVYVDNSFGRAFSFYNSGGTTDSYWSAASGSSAPFLYAQGATNTTGRITSNGTGSISIYTNGGTNQQFNVAHTASAVNYVQVTGAATGSGPAITWTGSDANVTAQFITKGTGSLSFYSNAGANRQVRIDGSNAAVNYLDLYGSVASSAPSVRVNGSDTNIDLTLTPKGTGNVRFGTYTASMALTVQGYIEIKDSGGTVRKLAVIA